MSDRDRHADESGGAADSGLPDEQVESILQGLPRPAPDPVFRARLREQFSSGAFAEAAPPRPRRLLSLAPAPLLALAAAAVFVLMTLPFAEASLDWEVIGLEGSGSVKIDGELVQIDTQQDMDEIARRLREGAILETSSDVEVTVKSESVVICIRPGACFELPATGPWWNPLSDGEPGRLEEGGVHVLMTRPPRDGPFRIETDDTVVKLSSCTVGVECLPDEGTCVCVFEGGARIADEQDEDCWVDEGERRFPCPEQHHPRTGQMSDEDRVMLASTHEKWSSSVDR